MYAIVIHMAYAPHTFTSSPSILSVRVNADERALLEEAAEQSHTSLSDFMRRKALESAEIAILNRTIVTIPAKQWEQFEIWMKRPAKKIPALAALERYAKKRTR